MKKLLIPLLLFIGVHKVSAQADPYHNTLGQNKTAVVKYIDADFGANPNDSYDDSKAFDVAARWFSNVDANGNSINNIDYSTQYGVLQLGSGTYIVDSQKVNNSISVSANHDEPIIQSVYGVLDGLIIQGAGIGTNGSYLSKIQIQAGAYFGFFNKSLPQDPHVPAYGNAPNTAPAAAGWIFDLSWAATNVIIKDIEMDGNSDTYQMGYAAVPGGDFNTASNGILIGNTKYISLENLYIHNFGEDGITLDPNHDFRASPGRWNITIDNVKSYWNGRQALSWTGGYDVRVQNSEFSYTRLKEGTYDVQSQVSGSPGCNIDIEPDNVNSNTALGRIRNGLFNNCKMVGNIGASASIAIQLDSDSLIFNNCEIKCYNDVNPNIVGSFSGIGFQSVLNRSFSFNNCDIIGCIDFVRRDPNFYQYTLSDLGYTRFNNCSITEPVSASYFGDYPLLATYNREIFDNCTIKQVNQRMLFEGFNVPPVGSGQAILTPDNYTTFNNCDFVSTYSFPSGAVDIRGRMYNLRFTGNTKWTHPVSSSSFDGAKILFQSATLNGSNIYAPQNTFTFPNLNVFEGQNQYAFYMDPSFDIHALERPIIIGETPCEYLKVYIGEDDNPGGSVFRNDARPLYIGEGVTITVRKNSALILSGDIYLAGKIIVESGGYLKFTQSINNSPIFPPNAAPNVHLLGSINLNTINSHIQLQTGSYYNVDIPYLWSSPYNTPNFISQTLRSDLMAPNEYLRSEVANYRSNYDNPSVKCPQCVWNIPTQQYNCTPIDSTKYHPFKGVASIGFDETSNIKIYPNPTNDKIYISTGNTDQPSDIQLLDINGRQLYKTTSKDAETEISLSKYPQGTYLIRISNATNSVVKKVVKTN